ncbi:E3 ubiquitin-protein ligase SPL2-like isoform X2 [Olea europaea var. sylvestris]|uniref:E3 ubiquitin-protein ligase SPL2-like isoform X2 n=1 Tax=Olea europaea var. sylvestris TaxID=158386 RepID=UPI000C1D028A|nr:E3 ubiquitin-protein ligase SPL2-like isoform X2 [Olea europaea var. sylvestris]
MSVHDQTTTILSQLLFAANSAMLGIGLAYVAIRSIFKFTASTSALRKIDKSPSVQPFDLRSLLANRDSNSNICNSESKNQSNGDGGKLIIVRGGMEAKSTVERQAMILGGDTSNVLVYQESGESGVILQRTQTLKNAWSAELHFPSFIWYWNRWKEWRQQRQAQQQNNFATNVFPFRLQLMERLETFLMENFL